MSLFFRPSVALLFVLVFLTFVISGHASNGTTVFGKRDGDATSPAVQSAQNPKDAEIAKKFVGKWKREKNIFELKDDGTCLWNGNADGHWRVTGENTIQQQNREGSTYTFTLSADRKTLTRPSEWGPFDMVRDSPDIPVSSATTPSQAVTEKAKSSDFQVELNQLCERYDKTFAAEVSRINIRDKSAIELLLQQAMSANDLDFMQRAKNALESIGKNEYIHDVLISQTTKSPEWDKRLLKIKVERDSGLKQAGKNTANRLRRDFESLQRRAVQEKDFESAKKIILKIKTLGDVRTSPFTGTWKPSWGHPNLIVIKNDDAVEGWGDRNWRQGKNLNEIEFFRKGNRWTSVCKLSADKNTLHLPDGNGKLWRQRD